MNEETKQHPMILAPAGNKDCFLAAIAAGADAIYCGLKSFSARMEAKNFSVDELTGLTQLAHDRGKQVYIAFNSLIKPDELNAAAGLIHDLNVRVKPDALIIQDLSLAEIARQVGFSGQLHFSTLANLSFPKALKIAEKLGISRVVLPRELSIDEIKLMSEACPEKTELEVFVHGALCYGISGRCYWSSFLGGKSGLRGRCVQPCRRFYTQGGQKKRFFSCMDLSMDVLVKLLMSVPKVAAWKIEGRKKSPHYVFYMVEAYRMLRDHGRDPQMKKTAVALSERALGRPGTHYHFLPQRPQNPVNTDVQTGSGLFMGTVKGTASNLYIVPAEELMSGDMLRIGCEDDPWHSIIRIKRYVPKRGTLNLKFPDQRRPPKGSPIFLTDRREKELEEMLREIEHDLSPAPSPINRGDFPPFPLREGGRGVRSEKIDLHVSRTIQKNHDRNKVAVWLSSEIQQNIPSKLIASVWWWLPPVIWPDEEKNYAESVDFMLNKGAKNFVLNAPWQISFFSDTKNLNLWAGPFCNIANALAIETLASSGFFGVIASPELNEKDYIALAEHSPLPLGIVISGNWPLCISRILSDSMKLTLPFSSPKGEEAYTVKYGSNFWTYPNWRLDLETHKEKLLKAGYSLFVYLKEPSPDIVRFKDRPGLWNWEHNLL